MWLIGEVVMGAEVQSLFINTFPFGASHRTNITPADGWQHVHMSPSSTSTTQTRPDVDITKVIDPMMHNNCTPYYETAPLIMYVYNTAFMVE